MNCRVVVEAAVPVYDVETTDEAVRIAISKTGEMLNPDLNYVEINMGKRACPNCGEEHDPAFIAADESLVALELEMTVFNVEREEHASRIARKEIGQRLEKIPLDVLEIEVIDDDDDDEDADETDDADSSDTQDGDDTDSSHQSDSGDDGSGEEGTDNDGTDDGNGDDVSADEEGREAVLPEFEELIDE